MYSPFSHPDPIIARGSIILTTLFVVSFLSTYATVEVAARSGEVVEYVVNPTKQAYQAFVEAIEKQLEEDAQRKQSAPEYTYTGKTATHSATVKTEINITTDTNGSGTTTTQQRNVIIVTPVPRVTSVPTTTTSDWEKEAAARQAQSRAEYEARVQQMNEDYNARVQQNQTDSKATYDEAVKQQQAEFDAKKAEMGF